jgi:hypothetical protein
MNEGRFFLSIQKRGRGRTIHHPPAQTTNKGYGLERRW